MAQRLGAIGNLTTSNYTYYFSVGYKHNSNGEDFGLNFYGGGERNPGIDGVFVGVGIRF